MRGHLCKKNVGSSLEHMEKKPYTKIFFSPKKKFNNGCFRESLEKAIPLKINLINIKIYRPFETSLTSETGKQNRQGPHCGIY